MGQRAACHPESTALRHGLMMWYLSLHLDFSPTRKSVIDGVAGLPIPLYKWEGKWGKKEGKGGG